MQKADSTRKTGGKAPRKQATKVLNIRVSEEIKEGISEVAEHYGFSVSEFIRARMLDEVLKHRGEYVGTGDIHARVQQERAREAQEQEKE